MTASREGEGARDSNNNAPPLAPEVAKAIARLDDHAEFDHFALAAFFAEHRVAIVKKLPEDALKRLCHDSSGSLPN